MIGDITLCRDRFHSNARKTKLLRDFEDFVIKSVERCSLRPKLKHIMIALLV